jgi:hypothetical protein
MGNKKAKQAQEDALAMEQLQSSIEKCITGVAMNYAAREGKEAVQEVKFDARWDKMFGKQEVKIDLLKTNVAMIKRKEDLALLTTDIDVRRGEGVVEGAVRHHFGQDAASSSGDLNHDASTEPTRGTKRRSTDCWTRR